MFINIKLAKKDWIRSYVLEQAIITYISYSIKEFSIPIEVEKTEDAFTINVKDEKTLRFYLESIFSYASYELIEFVNMRLIIANIEYEVIDNDGDASNHEVDANDLNDYFGKQWFKD